MKRDKLIRLKKVREYLEIILSIVRIVVEIIVLTNVLRLDL